MEKEEEEDKDKEEKGRMKSRRRMREEGKENYDDTWRRGEGGEQAGGEAREM